MMFLLLHHYLVVYRYRLEILSKLYSVVLVVEVLLTLVTTRLQALISLSLNFFSMSLPQTNSKNASFDDNFVPSMLAKDTVTNETVAVKAQNGSIQTSGNISSSRLTSISDWDIIQTGSGDLISSGGNTNASRYISIAKSNLNKDQITILASKQSFRIPAKINLTLTSSLAASFNEFFAGIVKVNSNGSIATETLPTPLAMPATISVTSNVATVVINNHGLRPNARVSFSGMARSSLNINSVQISVITENQFSFPITIANGTYNAGGFVYVQEPGYNFAELVLYNGSTHKQEHSHL